MDRALLLGARGLRALGFGFSAVVIGVYLERRGLSPGLIGLTLGIGLAAASLSGLASASLAARLGRRKKISIAGLLMAVKGPGLAPAGHTALLVGGGPYGHHGVARHLPRAHLLGWQGVVCVTGGACQRAVCI